MSSLVNLASNPVHTVAGEITVPGDKSISHRSIILSSIAQGRSVITGFLNGEDCMATLQAFRLMGVPIEDPVNNRVVVHGVGRSGLKKPGRAIDCGNSGTSIRLLSGLLAGQPFDSQLTGDASLLKRPMLRVSKPLAQMGAHIQTQDGKPPIVIQGDNELTAIEYVMPEASAQVKSCILLAGIYAKGTTKITESAVSRDHTERMLKTFGYPIRCTNNTIEIDSKITFVGRDIRIPGDISSAAFFIVAATIIPGAKIVIRDVGINPTRTGILHILKEMGAAIAISNERQWGEEPVADIEIHHAPLKGITINPHLVPLAIDEFPIIFIAAACADGQTVLRGAKELRHKESDRIAAMIEGLTAMGIDAEGFEDGLRIQGGIFNGGIVDSQGDHRIAMSFAIAGAVSRAPIIIKNCANIATSFPSFVSTANSLDFKLKEYTNNA